MDIDKNCYPYPKPQPQPQPPKSQAQNHNNIHQSEKQKHQIYAWQHWTTIKQKQQHGGRPTLNINPNPERWSTHSKTPNDITRRKNLQTESIMPISTPVLIWSQKKKKSSCEKEGDVMIWSRKKEEEAWCEKEGDGEADKKRENVERSERKRERKGRENERLEERENIKKIIPSCYSALIFECTVARYQN